MENDDFINLDEMDEALSAMLNSAWAKLEIEFEQRKII